MAIEKQCHRCKGAGWIYKKHIDRGVQQNSYRCPLCDGSGVNPDYREKKCEYHGGCYTTIAYSAKSSHRPEFCERHKEIVKREKQEAQAKRQREEAQKHQKGTSGGFYGDEIYWPEGRLLPGSDRTAADLRSKGVRKVAVRVHPKTGGYHVTLEVSADEQYSYDTDRQNQFVPKHNHYTDPAARLLGKDTIGPDATKKKRW